MELNTITNIIIGCAIEVHRQLGPGLLKSTYEACLLYELNKAGLQVKSQVPMPLIYKEVKLEQGYRLDLLVENTVVVEIKMVETIADVPIAKTLTYLKLSGAEVGLIINFNVLKLTDGIKRLIGRK
jgi:GxxExxY protein